MLYLFFRNHLLYCRGRPEFGVRAQEQWRPVSNRLSRDRRPVLFLRLLQTKLVSRDGVLPQFWGFCQPRLHRVQGGERPPQKVAHPKW